MIYHIDMSNHYDQKEYTVVGLVSVDYENKRDNKIKKAVVIVEPLRSELLKEFGDVKLHSAIISLIIEDLIPFKKTIMCPDIKPLDKVFGLICGLHPELVLGHLKPLSELREEIGDPNYSSEADAFVKNINRNFKKRRNVHRKKSYFEDGGVIILRNKSDEKYILLIEKLKKLRRFIESNR